MKTGFVMVGLSCVAGIHAQAQVDKAEQYRGMLLKRPENAVLFGRMVDAWLEKGEMAGLKERLETAATAGNAMDWRLLAVFRNFTGDEEGAIKALDEALKTNPDDPQSRLARAKSLGAASRFEEAIADLAIAAKDPASAMEAGTLKGKYLARAGRPAEAVQAWKEIIAAHPEDEGLQEDLIELEIGEGMLDEAVAAARELAAKTADPYQKALRQMHAAEILAQAGKKNEAVDEYRKVFAVSAESSWLEREVLARVNALFTREDDTAGLREFYQTMRDAYPRRVVVKKEAARSLLASGDGDEAVAMFREVLKVLPGDREARDEFIALLISASRFKEAGEEVMALLATAGQDGALWLKLAEIRKQANDAKGVTEAVDKAVALVPAGEAGKVVAAGIYERFARNDDALRILREATKEHGIQGEAGDALAVMLAAKGNGDEALALWKEMAKTADREGLLKIVRSLTANGRAADAFGILQSRLDGFEGDPLLLAALCQAAQFSDQSESAIPQALELVRQAKTTGDLETALRQASGLITRAKEPSQWVAKLAAKTDASPQELCLLAELHETLGDSLEADAVLKKAMSGGDPLMAAAQRVRLFEIRGDFDAAIAAIREWIALPGGMRTEQIKRLAGLYERTDNLAAAIEETANWKRIAPGDKSAWTKRAELLLTDGKPEESVAELRRAIAKFGGDEEMKSKLADSLAEAGLFAESWSMYTGLYDEAESPTSKIKWALSLAKLAAREGREEELVNDFRRRARDNPSSTVPLLALAEMFHEWERPEDELAVVEEASRRKPEDVSLVLRLAEIEEGNGSLEKAEAMIRKAVRVEDTPENRRRLSAFWIRNGDTERGLAEMLAARGPAASPRETERLVMPLVDAKDWPNALRILTPEVARHPDDWRLGYLHASVLLEHGSKDEALKRFNSLLGAKEELQGVMPLIPANRMGWMMQNDEEGGDFQMLAFFRNLTESENGRHGIYYGMAQAGMPVPGTLAELRPMALCRALSIASSIEDPTERAEKLALIQSPEIKHLAFVKSAYDLKPEELRSLLLADGTDPKYYQWYLQTINYSEQRRGSNSPDELKIWKKGADAALASDPKLALQFMSRLPIKGESGVGAEGAKRMVEMIDKLTGEDRSNFASVLHGIVHDDSKLVPDDIRRRAETILLTEFRKPDMRQGTWFADGLAIRWMQDGRFDDALALINEAEAITGKARASRGMNPMSPYFMGYGWQGGGGLEMLKFPEVLQSAVSHAYRSEFSTVMGEEGENSSENAKKLMKLLGNSDEEAETPELKPVDPKGLVKILPKIENPALRLFLALVTADPKVLEQTVSELEKSHRDQAQVLTYIAAYRISVDKDELAAYKLLVEAARFSKTGGTRNQIDGHLLQIGASLAAKPPAGFDIEPARRAALRLRKSMAMSDETKQQLATMMVSLGLEEQSKRYTAAPKAISSGRSPFGMRMGGRSNQSAADRLAVTALMTEGKHEAAARRMVSLLRKARAAASSGSNYEERQAYEMINELKLADEVAGILKPPGDAGFNSKRSYALALMELKKTEAALPILRELAKEKPDDFQIKAMLLISLPKAEQNDYVLSLSDAKFDADRIGEWFNNQFSRGNAGKVEDYFRSLELFVVFLEKLPVSFEAERNLTWVNYIAKDVFDNSRFEDANLKPLSSRNSSGSGKVDETKTKERNDMAIRLFHAMLKHPQTSEQGFILMKSMSGPLGIKDDVLEQAAADGLRLGFLLKQDERHSSYYGGGRQNTLWMWRSGSGGTRSGSGVPATVDPFSFLTRHKEDGGNRNPFTPGWIKELEKAEPAKAAELSEVVTLVESPGLDAFNQWAQANKENPRKLFSQMLWITRLASLKGRQDILQASVDLICDSAIRNTQNSQEFVNVAEVLKTVISGCTSPAQRMETVERITTRVLGPKEGWPLYREFENSYGGNSIMIRIGLYRMILQSIDENVECSLAFARFFAANRVSGLGRLDLSDSLRSIFTNPKPELIPKACIALGLFTPGPEIAIAIDGQQATIADGFWEALSYQGDDTAKKFAEHLMKVEGPERFWARVFAARINNSTPVLIAELDAKPKLVSSWPEPAQVDFAQFLRRWFPDIQGIASGSLKRLLDDTRKSGDAESRKLAETYLKEGLPRSLQPYSVDEGFGKDVMRIIGEDPELGAKVWLKALDHFKSPRISFSSSNNGFQQTALNYVNAELLELMSESDVSFADFASFIMFIEKMRPDALNGIFSSNGGYYFNQAFQKQMGMNRPAMDKNKELAAIPSDSRPLAWFIAMASNAKPPEARPVLATLLAIRAFYDMPSTSESKEILKWIRSSKTKLDPVLADVTRLLFLPPSSTGGDLDELKAAFARLATNEAIPRSFRIEMLSAYMMRTSAPFLKSDPASVSALAALFEDTIKHQAPWTSDEFTTSLLQLSSLASLSKEQAGKIFAAIQGNMPTRAQGRPEEGAALINKILFGLAIRSGDSAEILNIAKGSGDTLRGNFDVIVMLISENQTAAANLLAARPGEYHSGFEPYISSHPPGGRERLVRFTGEMESTLKERLSTVEDPAQRFRLECIISAMPDADKDAAPSVKRPERILALVKRFPAEAPAARSSRNEILAALGTEPAPARKLAAEFAEAIDTQKLGMVLFLREVESNNDGKLAPSHVMEVLILRAMRYAIEDGKDATMALEQLASLQNASTGNQSYMISQFMSRLGPWFCGLMLRTISLQAPAERTQLAKQSLEMAKVMFETNGRGSSDAEVYRSAVALAISSQAVAGDGAALDRWLAEIPKETRERYDAVRSRNDLRAIMQNLKTALTSGENADTIRRMVLTSFLTDPVTMAREIKHMTAISSLMDSGAFNKDDILAVIDALPAAHPRKAEFMCEKAGIIGWRGGKPEEAIAAYQAAEAAAGEDPKILDFIRSYHAMYLDNQLKRHDDAVAIAKAINLESLPERERKTTESILKKAEGAAKKQ